MKLLWIFIGLCIVLGILLAVDLAIKSPILHYITGAYGLFVFLFLAPIPVKLSENEEGEEFEFIFSANWIFRHFKHGVIKRHATKKRYWMRG